VQSGLDKPHSTISLDTGGDPLAPKPSGQALEEDTVLEAEFFQRREVSEGTGAGPGSWLHWVHARSIPQRWAGRRSPRVGW